MTDNTSIKNADRNRHKQKETNKYKHSLMLKWGSLQNGHPPPHRPIIPVLHVL